MMPALLLALVSVAAAAPVRFTVFHTNDVHGWFMSRPDAKEKSRQIGGMAAMKNAMAKLSTPGRPVLLLDAGDWFQGTPEGTLGKGLPMADFYNAMGYHAAVVGNHEFDLGEGALKALAARFKIPVLSANIFDKQARSRVPYAAPRLIREVAGVKVGLFGLTTSDMDTLQFASNWAGLEFRDEVAEAKEQVAALKAEGAEVIILVSHVGHDRPERKLKISEQDIAEKVPGITLIVGGHIHARTEKPVRIAGTQTWLANTGKYLTHVGRVELEVDAAEGKAAVVDGQTHPLWVDEFGEDKEILALTQKHQASVDKLLSEEIGAAHDELPFQMDAESPIADWVADCSRRWTKTQAAVQNPAGVRAALSKGPIRLRNMHEIMPFDNRITTLYMTGKDLKDVLEQGLSDAPGVPQVSGLRYAFRSAAPKGSQLVWAELDGRRLDDEAVYSVTAPDFLVQGGDGFTAFARGRDAAVQPTMVRDVLIWCVGQDKAVRLPQGDRIVAQ